MTFNYNYICLYTVYLHKVHIYTHIAFSSQNPYVIIKCFIIITSFLVINLVFSVC